MAGHLAIMGFPVNLYNRGKKRIFSLSMIKRLRVRGKVEGYGKLKMVTTDAGEAVTGTDVLMVVTPATAHRFIAEACAPHLQNGQIIVLNPGRTFGALEFRQVLKEKGCSADVIIAEAETLLYASRASAFGEVRIYGIKKEVPVASIGAHNIPKVVDTLREAFPQFVPGDDIFKTSLNNIGSIFHPAITILNTGWVENSSDLKFLGIRLPGLKTPRFRFYVDGCSPSVAAVLEKLDEERVAVAAALGMRAMSAKDWFYFSYGGKKNSLYEMIHSNPAYQRILSPGSLNSRYISEDVPCSLVPIASVGEMLGVPTPAIKSVIYLASAIHKKDYWKEGRTVEKLGIAGMTVKELRAYAIGEDV
ncbi:NADP transhydrogenase subunit alpha [Candidatus Desantisbacteria bacterium CG_4_10_14_0_8_um_filter_48_22]|uniref:NADP transhydrogenase subunit alpha n=1 Tax=Candidatus Desantisbacteria bacterium CG_4_10_14_0_8_um_filter_48_22 TaxID=1974543 RepID=A0A2M7SB83_9BACT|nr:MAG: NADP transhydrogenase subunit alpha [Candidatus Desantisbacteria bacterium CG1_02_49_89]PIV55469.1 MAG: NADP transhydrogenase subunit alpha [Candidatus Desantisbacteria bacterium CG02_land_8_20_14_3_00_49_13]PIZ16806.1 MAG: NADP transhydrogenase subunit alpha [Candidatus Desantisbacteria bacterium CG_4_10_14_0_8_um_filter_48_22]PJB27499.1 MAG: NADP transhydrogenase subunit alpha [Candidatus Desantisbacteria bacterium CG_4_9_14_3_um_filter_50_7]